MNTKECTQQVQNQACSILQQKCTSYKAERLNELKMRPIVSNDGTATYETAKFLNSLLAPLGKSDRSLLNTEAFVKQVKGQRIPEDYKMISLDVKNLFTNISF